MREGLAKTGERSAAERLWGWIQARVIRMDRSQWDGRALALAEAAIAAWREHDPQRPAAGFFEWASDLDRLAAWDQGEPADKGAGLRAYFKNLPGYGGDPMSSIPYEQHGYMELNIGYERLTFVEGRG